MGQILLGDGQAPTREQALVMNLHRSDQETNVLLVKQAFRDVAAAAVAGLEHGDVVAKVRRECDAKLAAAADLERQLRKALEQAMALAEAQGAALVAAGAKPVDVARPIIPGLTREHPEVREEAEERFKSNDLNRTPDFQVSPEPPPIVNPAIITPTDVGSVITSGVVHEGALVTPTFETPSPLKPHPEPPVTRTPQPADEQRARESAAAVKREEVKEDAREDVRDALREDREVANAKAAKDKKGR